MSGAAATSRDCEEEMTFIVKKKKGQTRDATEVKSWLWNGSNGPGEGLNDARRLCWTRARER